MATSKSTLADRPRKPKSFPLFPHQNGQWAKKIKGKLHYFGPWSDPDGAHDRYKRQREDLEAGRKPRPHNDDGVTVRDACNYFLTEKKNDVETGEIGQRHFDDLHRACHTVIEQFGKSRMVEDLRPADFSELRVKLAKRYKAATSLKREIANVRQIFNRAYQDDVIDRPAKFGKGFSAPGKSKLREARNARGSRLLDQILIHDLLAEASPHLRAFILLGLNAGLGNSDIAFMREHHVDLKNGWLQYPRRKTGVNRRAKLWPETVSAILEARAGQRKAKSAENHDLVFVTRCGSPWSNGDRDTPVSKEFRKLLDKCQSYRPGRSFYSLRHTFRTVADGAKDPPAIDLVMGHEPATMASEYRDRQDSVNDERLEAVANHVHTWLFGGVDND